MEKINQYLLLLYSWFWTWCFRMHWLRTEMVKFNFIERVTCLFFHSIIQWCRHMQAHMRHTHTCIHGEHRRNRWAVSDQLQRNVGERIFLSEWKMKVWGEREEKWETGSKRNEIQRAEGEKWHWSGGHRVTLSAQAKESLRQAASVLLRPSHLCKVHVTHGASLQGQTHSSQRTLSSTNLTMKLRRGASSGHIIPLGSELSNVDSNKRRKKALKLSSAVLNGKWKVIFLWFR